MRGMQEWRQRCLKRTIVLMGMERIVPTWKELDIAVSMLARHGTGQKIRFTQQRSTLSKEADLDGPEDIHIVIVDNGRSQILGSAYHEALKCIRCGAV